ncbi:amidase [Orrella sp. JC864]|uniref:amidase n=1 Tax=Orrella sp. JC864 TaxID=3120298 RepID=UPI00300B8D8E
MSLKATSDPSLPAPAGPPADAGPMCLDALLGRVRAADEQLRAWTWLGRPAGAVPGTSVASPLAGVPFGVKDVIDVAGMPTRSGSPATPSEPKPLDATCVLLLRQAGAVPIGKTVTAEFAYSAPGPTRNPHNPAHTPGGSSSGSAAAVAAGMVPFALGTQTGGSMIRPAAFCGVVGFKPSFGSVPRQGMHVLCETLDTIGWFADGVGRAAEIAQALMPRTLAPPVGGRPARVAVLPCQALSPLSPAAAQALRSAQDALARTGASLSTHACDQALQELLFLHTRIMNAELAHGLLPTLAVHGPQLSAALRQALQEGLAISHAQYMDLQRRRSALAARWRERFEQYDFILTPSAPGEAPAGHASTGSSVLNRVWSLLGWPCVHLPTGWGSHGMPVGVQWVGQPEQDHELLAWAHALHGALDQRQGHARP